MNTNTQSAQSTLGRYDVMFGVNYPMRVLQWATADEVNAHLTRTGCAIVSERKIGIVLHEVTIAKATGSTS